MKRWQIGLIGCTLLILLSGSALAQPTDVKPGHWAYAAVQTLVSRGYMDVEPGGVFDGEQAVQRYDLAVALAHLLDDIEAGRVQISAGVDVDLLRGLEREFRAELVQWYAQRDALEAAHGQTQRHIAVIDDQLNMLLLALDELHTSVRTELSAALAAEALRTDDQVRAEAVRTDELFEATNGRIKQLQELVLSAFGEYGESVGAQFDEQLSEMATLRGELNALIEDVSRNVHTALDELAADLDVHAADLNDLDQRVDRVNDQAAALLFRLNDLEQLLKQEIIIALEQQRVELNSRLSDMQADTERLEGDLAALAATLDRAQVAAGADAEASQSALDELHLQLDGAANHVNELRAAIALLEGRVSDTQRMAAEQRQLLEEQDAVLSKRLDRVEHDVDNVLFGLRKQDEELRTLAVTLQTDNAAMRAEIDAIANEMSTLHDVLGTSEDQIARMTERVRTQLDDQLALSLSRERQLERQLNELQAEFEGYKKQAAEEVSSARNMGTMALGAAALAILLSLMN